MIQKNSDSPIIDELAEQVREVGWCLVDNVIPLDKIEPIKQEISAVAHAHCSDYIPKHITHLPGTINYAQSFAKYLAHPRIIALVETFFGSYARVSSTTTTINGVGTERGEWHADWPFSQRIVGYIPAPYPDVMLHITTIWMLSAFTAENGGTLIRPRSHKLDTNPSAEPGKHCYPLPDEVKATGPAGSVLFFDSRLWHATAPNNSNHPRVALIVRYAPWWLNLEIMREESAERKMMAKEPGISDVENKHHYLPKNIYKKLPEVAKPLFLHWVLDN